MILMIILKTNKNFTLFYNKLTSNDDFLLLSLDALKRTKQRKEHLNTKMGAEYAAVTLEAATI